ncbi:hypothetical protein ASE78_12410 [Sphingomonas sp. Leaf25]|nr:hypothetical protein ASE78_12410 [Sphingomonas sp. Leaf25]
MPVIDPVGAHGDKARMTSDDAPFMAANGPTRRAKGGRWMAAACVAFLIGIGATLAVLYYVAPRLGWTLRAATTTPVAQPTPAASAAPVAAALPNLAALSAREATLSAQVAELETRIAAIDTGARSAAGFAARAENMMIVIAARRALDRGLPLGYLENQLRVRFGAARGDAVRTILAAARQPVTLDDLRSGLDSSANQLLAGPADQNWWQSLRREAGQLIVIRQGPTPSSRPSDRLERARRRLDTGRVELAIGEVERMPGGASATDWNAAAKRYVDARKALIELEALALDTPLPQVAPAPVAQIAPPPVPLPTPSATPDPLAPTL